MQVAPARLKLIIDLLLEVYRHALTEGNLSDDSTRSQSDVEQDLSHI